MYTKLASLQELGTSPRLGGRFVGPLAQTAAIWRGRPPTLEQKAGATPRMLSMALRQRVGAPLGAGTVTSVGIHAECGNAFGGVITRDFNLGQGLSADLAVGSYRHVRVVTTSVIPADSTLFFCWTDDLPGATGHGLTLTNYVNYPAAGVRTLLPEGAFLMIPEVACQITFTMVSLGATFVRAAAAGEAVPVTWGSFSCNVPNQFMIRLRSF
jgi:hypothetical protein